MTIKNVLQAAVMTIGVCAFLGGWIALGLYAPPLVTISVVAAFWLFLFFLAV